MDGSTTARLIVISSMVWSLATGCASRTATADDIIANTTAITENYTPTPTVEFIPTPEATKEPATYRVEAADGPYTEAQRDINNSQSALDQQARIQRWLDYWINFDNRPFTPDTAEISWKYIYDSPEEPIDVLVLIEAKGEYGNKLFSVPLENGNLADYPPKVEGDNIQANFGPLELTGETEGQWLSVEQGVPVRKDANSKIVEKLNMATGQWEVVKPNLSSEQQLQLENAPIYYEKRFSMKPDEYTLSFDKDGLLLATDNISERVIAKGDYFIFNDADNTTGKDQLEDGTWVFNNNLKERLSGNLEKTRLKGVNGARNDPSLAVDNYNWNYWDAFRKLHFKGDKGNEELDRLSGVTEGEHGSWVSVFLYKYPDGAYAWGLLLGKGNKGGWVQGPRQLFYMTSSKEYVNIPIYFPNYLIYR
ncbi:MAG: hypothetical protein U1B80_09075 [Anaerolineaceae bacterium]|nr:hypothetical protein [Anaerolineaceae bacterium]